MTYCEYALTFVRQQMSELATSLDEYCMATELFTAQCHARTKFNHVSFSIKNGFFLYATHDRFTLFTFSSWSVNAEMKRVTSFSGDKDKNIPLLTKIET